ncbi:ABC transporter substrate-binding protein [uncultured Mailhella sp.]|uniref:ABC transporter substrate-binding protein n=1 Tax=uncultured Mailhella sp. TaxID=1981031 RepID=UPI0025EEB714|nr:ABC transporter substrate-binding protein [uncultured Mailhella sp.]
MYLFENNRFSRRTFLKGMAAGAAAVTLCGVPGLALANAPKRGGTLRVSVSRELKSLNPYRHVNLSEYMQGELMYSGLVKLSHELKAVPDLAESWESSDAVTWRFRLRKGVRFQNGKEVTADDAVASIRKVLDPETASPGRKNIGPITSVDVEDKYTVRVVTAYPFSFLPQSMAYPCMKICPKEVLEGDYASLATKGCGSGPFKLREYVPGTHVIFDRNPDYFDGDKPYLDEVQMLIFPDSVAETNALLTGQSDWVLEANISQLAKLKEAGIVVTRTGSGQFPSVVYGCDMKPFTDMRVRQAISLSLDRQMALDMCLEGFGRIGNDNPVSPEYPFYHQLPERKQDLDKAARLLSEAGFRSGSTIPMYIAAVPAVRGKLGIVLQQCAAQIGVKIRLQHVDYSTFLDQYWKKANFYVGFYNMQSCEDALFQLLYTSDASWNETRWNNKKFDQLVLQARQQLDPEKQRKAFADCQELLYEEVPSCVPFFLDLVSAYQSKVNGIVRNPRNTFFTIENVWLS